ncbi:hypothetical protein MMC26_003596 [Xylographa opegraphella]|nr:hypothetical protein [Xylographa opegraphella]
MPGVKSIVWSDANDSKLLRALLVCGNVQITPQVAEQIAAYMANGAVFDMLGPGVPGRAILSRVMLTKKKYKDEIAAGIPVTTARPVSKKRPASDTSHSVEKKITKTIKNEPQSDLEDGAAFPYNPATPPKTLSKTCSIRNSADGAAILVQASSTRSSPRAIRSVDYNVLHDSFGAMNGATDEDGQNVFGDDAGNSSEDSADSDELFAGTKEGFGDEDEEY